MHEPSYNVRRLSDLHGTLGGDTTLQNLLETTRSKLERCGRLAVHEYEAHLEGHETAALAFGELAAAEHAACCDLLRHLRRHLDETLECRDPEPASRCERGPTAP